MPNFTKPSTAREGWTQREMPEATQQLVRDIAAAVLTEVARLETIEDSNEYLSGLTHVAAKLTAQLALEIGARAKGINMPLLDRVCLDLALRGIDRAIHGKPIA